MQQHTLIEIVTFADSLALRGSQGQWDMNRLLWWRSAKAIFLRKKMSPLPSPFSFSFLSLTWAQSLEQQQPSCDDEVTVMRMMMTRCLHHLRMMPTSKTDVSIYLPCGTGSALGSLPSDFLFGVQINPYLFKPLLVKFSIFFFFLADRIPGRNINKSNMCTVENLDNTEELKGEGKPHSVTTYQHIMSGN